MRKKFIGNDIENGLMYDFKKIAKRYNDLNCPEGVYNPLGLLNYETRYKIILSERSRGKTTNILLMGMLFNAEYGTTMGYVRQSDDMITRKNTIKLFDTIREFGYIEKITNGKWHDLYYYGGGWYYANYDDMGKRVDKSEKPFMTLFSLRNVSIYKSSFSDPLCDFIIYDEFINKNVYRMDEFPDFMDLLKTITRDRLSPIIFLLSNMVDLETPYFREFEIYDDVVEMKTGDSIDVRTPKGTGIHVEVLESLNVSEKVTNDKRSERRKKNIELFYGFKNKKLVNITGGSWVVDSCQHIPHGVIRYEKMGKIYVRYYDEYIMIEDIFIHNSSDGRSGEFLLVKMSHGEIDDECVVFTDAPMNDNELYGVHGCDGIWRMIADNRALYENNSVYSKLKNYLKLFC